MDDLYRQFAPPEVAGRRHVSDAKLSDSEIITIAICGELVGVDSERAWHSFVKRNCRHLFPNLRSGSRFNRTRRALSQTTELPRQKLPAGGFRTADSFPLPVCKFGRARYCRAFRGHGADYGKRPSKKETYFGYKAHVLATLEGYVSAFETTPASTDDREGPHGLVSGRSGLVILGDKGYVGEALAQDMERQGVRVLALKRSNSKTDWPKPARQLVFKLRGRIETAFSQLSGQLNAERVLAKSPQGLCARLVDKILAYDLCLVLNDMFYGACEMARIKQIIF